MIQWLFRVIRHFISYTKNIRAHLRTSPGVLPSISRDARKNYPVVLGSVPVPEGRLGNPVLGSEIKCCMLSCINCRIRLPIR